jgi:alpha-tubulin suppressor-like RCC1 family protein
VQIKSGKSHQLNLTIEGEVFSMGAGEECTAGHGGSRKADKPQLLKPLKDKRVAMIACGEAHSLVLTDKGCLYTWGRGYEGQLGLSAAIEIASTPRFVKDFYNKNVTYVAAGSFYSLAITDQGEMYGWGEARMG